VTKNYDQLTTDTNRHVNYRTQRHSPNELLGSQKATVSVAGREFSLYDIAMNSLSFIDSDAREWEIGSSSDVLISINKKEMYRGSSEIARLEHSSNQIKVALKITDGFIDLPKLQHSFTALKFEADLAQGIKIYRDQLPQEYLDTIYDFGHFLSYFRKKMERFEKELRRQGDFNSEDIISLAQQGRQHFASRWKHFQQVAARTSESFYDDNNLLAIAKTFTENMITEQIIGAPLADRCYNKPLGYPGDYVSMLHIYASEYLGSTSFDAMIHKLMSELPLASGVRTRKDKIFTILKEQTSRVMEENSAKNDQRFFSATSLGCGPAVEISDYAKWFSNSKYASNKVSWTLIDQEERALSQAYSGAHKAIGSNTPNFSARCVYMSFLQMLKDTDNVIDSESQDIIYSIGLFDYLKRNQSQRLVKSLFDKIKPGGSLIICNALAPNESQWFAEFVLDWTLIYRNSEDLMDLGKLVKPLCKDIHLHEEDSHTYRFIQFEKRTWN